MLVLAGAAALAALSLEADPRHDLSLVILFTAWTILGVLLLRRVPRTPDIGGVLVPVPTSTRPGHTRIHA